LSFLVSRIFGKEDSSFYAQKPRLNIPFKNSISGCGQGLLDLYAATLDAAWLGEAVRLQGKQDELFLDTERGGYFTSKPGDEFVIIRLKEDQVTNLYFF
jgi:hypothetical protein